MCLTSQCIHACISYTSSISHDTNVSRVGCRVTPTHLQPSLPVNISKETRVCRCVGVGVRMSNEMTTAEDFIKRGHTQTKDEESGGKILLI